MQIVISCQPVSWPKYENQRGMLTRVVLAGSPRRRLFICAEKTLTVDFFSAMSNETHTLSIEHEGDVYDLYYKPTMDPEVISGEIQRVLNLPNPVVALIHLHFGAVFPLSLLGLFPVLFVEPDTRFAPLMRLSEDNHANPPPPSSSSGTSRVDPSNGEPELTGEALWDDEPDLPVNDAEDDDDAPDVLQHIQQDTEFSRLSMSRLMSVFREAATSSGGRLGRESFERAYMRLVGDVPFSSSNPHATDSKGNSLTGKAVANRLFSAFDKDGNGYVDFQEFVAGLSLLCRDSSTNKISAAFDLFDTDGDGYISHEEMIRYMTSFFEVLFALDTSGVLRNRFGGDISAEQVGRATAEHCFERADTNIDGKLSYDEFKEWCMSDDGVARSFVNPVN